MENLIYSRVRGEELSIFQNTGKMVGVQDISIDSTFGATPIIYLGIGNSRIHQTNNSEQYADVSVNSLLLNSDPFYNLTGDNPFNLFLLKDKNNISNNYCLLSGYLNSYNLQVSQNQPIQISTSLRFYHNAGAIATGQLDTTSRSQLSTIRNTNYDYLNSGLLISNGNTINLTLDEYNTERVQDVSVQFNCNRIPVYAVGKRCPVRVDLSQPIETIFNCSFQASKIFSGIELKKFPNTKKEQNISLEIKDYSGVQTISNYILNNMTLISENESVGIDGNLVINRSYIGYR